MSTPILIQNQATSVVVYLELTATGLGATGLTFADVTCDIKKSGDSSFSTFTLSALNFTELDEGYYEVDLATTDTDDLGNLYLRFSTSTTKPSLVVANVVAAPVAPSAPAPVVIPTTAIEGYIYNLDGTARESITIAARILSQPTIVPTGVALMPDVTVTATDEDGYFVLDLLTGAQVEVQIPALNYRRTITVPASPANLFTLE
jgi:hypothetical protein